MDHLLLAEKLLKIIRDRQQVVSEQLQGGPVPDFAVFQGLRGRYAELTNLESELKTLLKKEAVTDD